MFLEFIISSAHSTVSHRLPGEHREVIEERIFKLDIEKFPGINYTRDEILQFNAAMAFEEGYSLLSRGLEMEAAAAR
jgi:hypothetical protein